MSYICVAYLVIIILVTMSGPGDDEHQLPPAQSTDKDPFREMAEMFHRMSTKEGRGENLQMLQKQMVDFLIATNGLPEVKDKVSEGAVGGVPAATADSGGGRATSEVTSSASLDTRFYKLPTFSGERGKGDSSFELWRFEVQCLIDTGRHIGVIGQSIRRSLRGSAAEVAMRMGSVATPAEIIAKFRSFYGVVDDQETLLENFYSAHQLPDETVTDWACRLEGLLTRADSSLLTGERNMRLHNKFWSGLRQDLREVSGHKADSIDSYEDLCIAVRSIERSREKMSDTGSAKPKSATAKSAKAAPDNEGQDDLKAMVNQLTAAIKSLEKKFEGKPSNTGGYRGNSHGYRGQGHRGDGYSSRGRGRGYGNQPRPDIICWRCGQPGHIKARCETVLSGDLNGNPPTTRDQQ